MIWFPRTTDNSTYFVQSLGIRGNGSRLYIIQMVLTLIRATRKTTLNCMSDLSVCLVPNVHCTQSQQLRTICTCVTDNTHKFV